jgi:hypothetical protein
VCVSPVSRAETEVTVSKSKLFFPSSPVMMMMSPPVAPSSGLHAVKTKVSVSIENVTSPSEDTAVETSRETSNDTKRIYKETALDRKAVEHPSGHASSPSFDRHVIDVTKPSSSSLPSSPPSTPSSHDKTSL